MRVLIANSGMDWIFVHRQINASRQSTPTKMILDIGPPQRFSFLLLEKGVRHQTLCTTHNVSGSDVIDKEMLSRGISLLVLNCIKNRGTPQFISTMMHAKQHSLLTNAANLHIKIASAELALDRTLFEFVSHTALKLRREVRLRPDSCSNTQEWRRCQSITAPYVPTQSWEEDESGKAKWAPVLVRQLCQGREKKKRRKIYQKAWSEVHVIHPPLTLHLNLLKWVTDISCGSTPCCSSPARQLISVRLQLRLTSWAFTCRHTCSPLLIRPSSYTPEAKDPRWSRHASYLFHISVDSVKFEDLFAISVDTNAGPDVWNLMVSEETLTATPFIPAAL